MPPLNLERQELGKGTFEQFTQASLQQLKEMFRLPAIRTTASFRLHFFNILNIRFFQIDYNLSFVILLLKGDRCRYD